MTPPDVTLRDRFAEAALAGLLASKEHEANPNEWFACNAWGVADAMIAERERRAKVEAEKAEREAREWVASAGLAVAPNAWGGVYLMDGGRVLGCGHDLVAAVADARAKLATDPAPLAPVAQPAPSTPTAEDDLPDTVEKVARLVDTLDLSDVPTPDPKAFAAKLRAATTPTAEDDEAWARKQKNVTVLMVDGDCKWEAMCSVFSPPYGGNVIATGPTISAALRALRAKVEGRNP